MMLGVCTILACSAVLAVGGPSTTALDPDLTRLMRFMAALKGGFALVALAACAWRLGRPAASWRKAVYVVGPGAMAAGALALWQGQAVGLATIGLHAGMFALLATALTDEAFIPAQSRATR